MIRPCRRPTNEDIKVGSTSTRIDDFVNGGQEFDNLYVLSPFLNAWNSCAGGRWTAPPPLCRSAIIRSQLSRK